MGLAAPLAAITTTVPPASPTAAWVPSALTATAVPFPAGQGPCCKEVKPPRAQSATPVPRADSATAVAPGAYRPTLGMRGSGWYRHSRAVPSLLHVSARPPASAPPVTASR